MLYEDINLIENVNIFRYQFLMFMEILIEQVIYSLLEKACYCLLLDVLINFRKKVE